MNYLVSYEKTPLYFVERNYVPFPGETQDKYNLRTAVMIDEYKRDRKTRGRYYLVGKIAEAVKEYECCRTIRAMGLWEYEYLAHRAEIDEEIRECYRELAAWMIDKYYNKDSDPHSIEERNRLTGLVGNWLFNPPKENENPHCPICSSDYIFNHRNMNGMTYICQPTAVWDWADKKLTYDYGLIENGGVMAQCTLCPQAKKPEGEEENNDGKNYDKRYI